MKKRLLEGYRTYDPSTGHGHASEWQRAFSAKMGLEEACQALGLSADAGWEAICQALRLAAMESMTRLVGDYERAVQGFETAGRSRRGHRR